MGPW